MEKPKEAIQMKTILARHDALLERQKQSEAILAEVSAFITDLQEYGSQFAQTDDRNQLRALLRYWSGHVYDQTGAFPTYELKPYAGPPVRSLAWLWLILAVVGIGLLIFLLLSRVIGPNQPTQAESTQIAAMFATQTAQMVSVSGGKTLTPTPEASPTLVVSSPTFTLPPQPQPSVTPRPTETPYTSDPLVEMQSPRDGQALEPVASFYGQFYNLEKDTAIYILLRPVSAPDRYYIVKDTYTIPEGINQGAWAINTKLNKTLMLDKAEQYDVQIVTVGPAETDARRALEASESVPNLPKGAYPMKANARVSTGVYLSGPRLLYLRVNPNRGEYDLYTADLEAKNEQRIPFTATMGEFGASTSPDGKQLAFAARRDYPTADGQKGKRYELRLGSSDGETSRMLKLYDFGYTIERVRWSPDGGTLVYAGGAAANNITDWQIYLYDLKSGEECQVTGGRDKLRYPEWVDRRTLVALRNGQALVQLKLPEKCDSAKVSFESIPLPAGRENLIIDKPVAFYQANQKLIAFIGTVPGAAWHDLYLLDVVKGTLTRLTENHDLFYVTWGPDGKMLYYQDGTYLYQIDWTSLQRKVLVKDLGDDLNLYVGPFDAYFAEAR